MFEYFWSRHKFYEILISLPFFYKCFINSTKCINILLILVQSPMKKSQVKLRFRNLWDRGRQKDKNTILKKFAKIPSRNFEKREREVKNAFFVIIGTQQSYEKTKGINKNEHKVLYILYLTLFLWTNSFWDINGEKRCEKLIGVHLVGVQQGYFIRCCNT